MYSLVKPAYAPKYVKGTVIVNHIAEKKATLVKGRN